MAFLARYTGKVLDFLLNISHNHLAAVSLFAMLGKLAFFSIGKRYFDTIHSKQHLDEVMEKEHPKDMEALIRLLGKQDYPILGGLLNLLGEALFSIGIIGVFRHPENCLDLEAAPMTTILLDLTLRPVELLYLGEIGPQIFTVALLILLTLSAFVATDWIMDRYCVFGTDYNKVIWVLFFASMLVFPVAYTWYWLCVRLWDLLQILLARKKYVGVSRKL